MTWDTDFAWSILPELLRGLVTTVQAVAIGMTLALLLGLALALARRARNPLLARGTGAAAEFVRRTPLLVQLYSLYYLLPGTFSVLLVGVLALGIHYATYTAEVYRAGIEGVPHGQWDAARALGLRRMDLWLHVILPQAVPPMIPALGNYLIAMFKDTPLLFAITVLEVLRRAWNVGNETFRYLEPLTLVGVLYLALSLLSGLGVAWLERRQRTVHA